MHTDLQEDAADRLQCALSPMKSSRAPPLQDHCGATRPTADLKKTVAFYYLQAIPFMSSAYCYFQNWPINLIIGAANKKHMGKKTCSS